MNVFRKENYDEIVGYIKERTPDFDENEYSIFVYPVCVTFTKENEELSIIDRYGWFDGKQQYSFSISPDKKWLIITHSYRNLVYNYGLVLAETEFVEIKSYFKMKIHIGKSTKETEVGIFVIENIKNVRDKVADRRERIKECYAKHGISGGIS